MAMQILLIILGIQTSFIVHGDISIGAEVSTVSESDNFPFPEIAPVMFESPRKNVSNGSSAEDFPNFFTDHERENGAIVLPFLIGIYCFTLLALVCDNYFLPCVERICEFLNLSQDVAAATFMAMATSAPELFVNVVGTFITESDLGIGTIVGSSMFNTLGVAALGGLAARTPIQLDWWPVSRDSFLYLTSIVLLVLMSWDGKIYWYEGMILFMVYFIYFAVMFNNRKISMFCKGILKKLQVKLDSSADAIVNSVTDIKPTNLTLTPPLYLIEERANGLRKISIITTDPKGRSAELPIPLYSVLQATNIENKNQKEAVNVYLEINPTKAESQAVDINENIKTSRAMMIYKKLIYFYTLPLRVLLFCIVPDSDKRPKLFPITFILCIVIIGGNSYIISWMITIIGHTFNISDTVLGLTFLAAGGCLPEAISITIMSRKGEGSMGISNALGANSMNILLSLGLPWFIKTLMIENREAQYLNITTGAIEYTILSLILVVMSMFLTLFFHDFKLQKRTGIILVVIYLIFLSFTLASALLLVDT